MAKRTYLLVNMFLSTFTVFVVVYHLWTDSIKQPNLATFGNIIGPVNSKTYQADKLHVGNVSDHDVSGNTFGNVSDHLHVGNASDHDVSGNTISGNTVGNVSDHLHIDNLSDHDVSDNTVSDDVECEHGEKRLPDCIIIGVQKGGTKALLQFLSAHPQVVRNELMTEYHFFDYRYNLGMAWYRENMPCSLPDQIVIEKTPRYFRSRAAPKRLFEMDPNIKLLLIVRNPVQRALSMYGMYKRYHESKPYNVSDERFKYGVNSIANMSQSFETSWKNYIQVYDSDLENWLKYFKLDQIHIVDSAAFEESPAKELTKIEDFLKIRRYFEEEMFVFVSEKGFHCIRLPGKKTHCLGDDKGHHHPNISLSVLKEMTEYLRPYNERFYQLSGKHFGWD